MEKSEVLIQFLLIFRQFGDVLFFLYARRLRGYTATGSYLPTKTDLIFKFISVDFLESRNLKKMFFSGGNRDKFDFLPKFTVFTHQKISPEQPWNLRWSRWT